MRLRRGRLGQLLTESFSVRRPRGAYVYAVSVNAEDIPRAFQAIISLRRDAETVDTTLVMQRDAFYVSLTPPLTNIYLNNEASAFQTEDQIVRWKRMKKAAAIPTRNEIMQTVTGVLTILHIEERPEVGRQLLYCEDVTQRVA